MAGSDLRPGAQPWADSEPWLPPAPGAIDAYTLAPASTPPYSESASQRYAVTPAAAWPELVPLPAVDESATALPMSESPREIAATPSAATAASTTAVLLAPQAVPADEPNPAPGDAMVVDELPTLSAPSPAAIAAAEQALRFPDAPAAAAPVTSAAMQSAAAPTGAVVNARAVARIRRGYELAERGAYFASRTEFLATLRMIAEAKDQIHGAARRTVALNQGLKALDEAADFAPIGGASAGKLNVTVIVAAHSTPAAKELAVDEMLPQQVADAYFRYAETQLAAAVAGEPAGSMALHALGKLHSQLGRVEPAANPQADARAFALQQAALLARPDNHLAAHELGVLLAETGHYVESDQLLRQVAQRAPHAVVYRNLARVERQLGRPDLAQASEQQASLLAARGADNNAAVTWVATEALARTPEPLGPSTGAMNMATAPAARPAVGQPTPMIARGPAPSSR